MTINEVNIEASVLMILRDPRLAVISTETITRNGTEPERTASETAG